MTPKEITTLAGHRLLPPWVMKLALNVAAAEREACAKSVYDSTDWAHEERDMVLKEAIAAAIRSRSSEH